jgi:tetratricopeptide (TPR) repeat protein
MGATLTGIGIVHYFKGDLDTALDYCGKSLAIREEIGDKQGIGLCLFGIGNIYAEKDDYDTALDYFERSLAIQKEIGTKAFELLTTTYLYLTYNHLGKQYNEQTIHTLIKESGEKIGPIINYRLFELLEDTSYLETAYNQVQKKASAMEDGAKFLELPIPKAIVEEWEKVK